MAAKKKRKITCRKELVSHKRRLVCRDKQGRRVKVPRGLVEKRKCAFKLDREGTSLCGGSTVKEAFARAKRASARGFTVVVKRGGKRIGSCTDHLCVKRK